QPRGCARRVSGPAGRQMLPPLPPVAYPARSAGSCPGSWRVEASTRIGFGLLGLAVLIGITWLFSNNRRGVDWKLIATGLGLQILIACFVLLTSWGAQIFDAFSRGFVAVLGFTAEGSAFIFGDFSNPESYGFIFAFQVLPTIIFFASLMSVLYHIG